MGKEFDWNKFETKKEVFDWSQFESTPSSPKEEPSAFTMKGLARGFTEALPFAGGLAGGALAFPLGGPVASVAGSGLGAGLGEAIKNFIKQQAFNESAGSLGENIKNVGAATLSGAAQEIGGQFLTKGLSKIPLLLAKKAAPNANIDDVVKATQALGVKPVPGQLTADPYVGKIQSALEQSPSFAGSLVRKETDPLRKAISTSSEDVFAGVPSKQASDIGAEFKTGLKSVVEGRVAPLKKVFDDVRASSKFIDVNPTSLQRVSKNIRGLEKFESSNGYIPAQKIADDILKIKSVDDIKVLKTSIRKMMQGGNIDGAVKGVLSNSYARLSNLEEDTLIREAIKQGRTSNEGMQVGFELVGDLKSARSGYRSIMEDLKDVGKGSGVDKNVENIELFLSKVDDIPDEKVVDTFFKTGNRKALTKLKEFDPTGFEALRLAKLDKIRAASEVKGSVNPSRLLKNVSDIEPQTRKLIFGENADGILSNLKTVVNSMPEMVGPSGTPAGIDWFDFLSPASLTKEPVRLAQYGLMKMKAGGGAGQFIPESIKRAGPVMAAATQGAVRYQTQTAIQRRLDELLNNLGGQ